MDRRSSKETDRPCRRHSRPQGDVPASVHVVAQYAAALGARDGEQMAALRAPDFVLDYVHRDASGSDPLPAQATQGFWTAWFTGFPEMDFEVTRTIAADRVAVLQWTLTGTHSGPLDATAFGRHVESTGRTISLRGVSIFDIDEGLIQHETLYIDFATLWVELGVEL
jgi:steroid delta-isomerase-like uncharacterized protein